MATVERRQLVLLQPFDDGKDGCIDEPNIGIGVAIAQLSDSGVVGLRGRRLSRLSPSSATSARGLSHHLISERVKDVSATEASRRFSEMLDAVEHGNESFRIVRAGRPVARITPIARANGAEVVEVLRSYSADPVWADDLQSLRSLLNDEERHWPG